MDKIGKFGMGVSTAGAEQIGDRHILVAHTGDRMDKGWASIMQWEVEVLEPAA
ncbi:hypothetical protein WKI65_32585 [Streptomyces sp. MS1.AVA.3]|uniref:hypothetical protein n=1 Tax=Streptomyces decoyicus TaxID=249567 RepID=UPI0030BD251A